MSPSLLDDSSKYAKDTNQSQPLTPSPQAKQTNFTSSFDSSTVEINIGNLNYCHASPNFVQTDVNPINSSPPQVWHFSSKKSESDLVQIILKKIEEELGSKGWLKCEASTYFFFDQYLWDGQIILFSWFATFFGLWSTTGKWSPRFFLWPLSILFFMYAFFWIIILILRQLLEIKINTTYTKEEVEENDENIFILCNYVCMVCSWNLNPHFDVKSYKYISIHSV